MSEKPPIAWTELQQRWQSEQVPVVIELEARRRVRRDHRRLLLELILTGIAVLSVGTWSVYVLTTEPETSTVVTMVVFWTFAGILIGAGVLNLRGTWTPADESTRSYLRLSLEGALRREELSRFSLWLMAFWLVVAAGLMTWSAIEAVRSGQALLPVLGKGIMSFGLTFGVLGAFAERGRRTARKTAAELEDTLRALDEDGANGNSTEERASHDAPP